MIRVMIYVLLLMTSVIFGQADEKAEVKLAVDTFFDGFHKGDTIKMKSVMADKILMQTTYRNKQGKAVLLTDDSKKFIKTISTRPADQKWDERLLGHEIKIDGNMAHVWIPYEFWFNGKFSHCGVNSFQLFNNGEQWKIIYLIDTRRKSTCNK